MTWMSQRRGWWRMVRGGTIAGVLVTLLSVTPTPQAASSTLTQGDYGDAPDTNQDGQTMLAHPFSDPTIIARYPTVGGDNLRGSSGPWHREPWSRLWLGLGVSSESNADVVGLGEARQSSIEARAEGTTSRNWANKDTLDDGLAAGGVFLPDCKTTAFAYTVSAAPGVSNQAAHINAWLDFNGDGDWLDTLQCLTASGTPVAVPEWAVANQPISVSGTASKQTPLFYSARVGSADHLWMRITVTESALAAQFSDGSGPATGHRYGETEDYALYIPSSLTDQSRLSTLSDGPYEPDATYYDGY